MTSVTIERRTGLKSASAVKGPCRAATTANIALTGEQTIDGVAVIDGDRVLVKNQTDGRENGIWIVSTGNWQRSPDFRDNNDIAKGTSIVVTGGTVSAWKRYYLASDDPVTIGVDALSFLSFPVEGFGILTPQVFGAVSDGVANDTAAWTAFQAASGVKAVPAGNYLIGDPLPEDGKPFVVLASGQSNMVGYSLATGGASSLPSNPNVHMWLSLTNGGTPQWIQNPDFVNNTYYPPIEYVDGYTGMGNGTCTPSLAFAHRLAAETGRPVWLVMDGKGGANLGQWNAGVSSPRYASMKANLEAALPLIPGSPSKVQFFLWQQGEANYLNPVATYQAGLETFYDQLEAESWWASNTRFIAGLPNQANALYDDITTAIEGFVAADPTRRDLADTTGLAVMGDNVHFTGSSLFTLGYSLYWKNFAKLKTFNSGVFGNGNYDETNYAHPELATDGGNKLKDSAFVHCRTIDNGEASLYSGPAIVTQTQINLEIPDTATGFTDFKQFYGSAHELKLTGYYDFDDDGNHNYSTSVFSTRNNMAGMMGSTALCAYSYDAKETETPNILTMGATKTGTAYFQTTRRARYASGGYTLGLEIYSLNQSDDVDTDVPYTNNDTGSFTAFDASVKLTAGGAGSPITHAIMITGLGSKHGYYNGINIGGSAFRINDDTQGPAGTVSVNGVTQRSATGFSEYFVKYGENKRHHYYVRENAKSRSAQHRFMHESTDSGLSIECGNSSGYATYIQFRKGVDTSKDGNYSGQTNRARIDATDSIMTLSADAGVIRLKPNDTASGVGYEANTVRFAPYSAADGVPHLGGADRRWNTVYATTGTINTSDERAKTPLEAIPDEVLDAWGEVGFGQFQMLDAIALKGDEARIHAGVIAQRVIEAFARHDLDATRYGLLCFDRWEATPEERNVTRVMVKPPVYAQIEVKPASTYKNRVEVSEGVFEETEYTVPAEYEDDESTVIEEAVYDETVTVVPGTPAGELYGIRYEEGLCMEAAYQRRRAERLESRITAIETALGL